ncbi:glutamine synthetase, partial [Mycobacterium tuberculosis]
FVRAVPAAAPAAGLALAPFPPASGAPPFALSFAPPPPVAAAAPLVLTRLLLGRPARRPGFRVRLSPAPFAGRLGSG